MIFGIVNFKLVEIIQPKWLTFSLKTVYHNNFTLSRFYKNRGSIASSTIKIVHTNFKMEKSDKNKKKPFFMFALVKIVLNRL